jgi:SAM-dependent methyltransferase
MNPAEYDRMDAVERDHWWYRGLRDLIGRSIRRLEAPRASPLRILDAGCGTGETLRWLNDRLHPAYLGGFDISPVALARAAKKVPAADLYLADICDPEVHVPELDLVLSCDAADVPGIDAALPGLCRLVQALRPGGMFILNLPAFSWLRSRHDVAVHSRQRFTRPQVHALFDKMGLVAELVTYRVWTLFPAIVLVRLPSILRRPSDRSTARSDVGVPWRTTNTILSSLLLFENRVIDAGGRFPWGSSVFAVGRKPSVRDISLSPAEPRSGFLAKHTGDRSRDA